MTVTARKVEVPAERVAGWFDRFSERHGVLSWSCVPDAITAVAADGAMALCAVPFPPLSGDAEDPGARLAAHALLARRVGVVLVRRGGYAAGVFDGTELVASKVGSRLVQGRTAAGGQSQQRFARRRDNQARKAYEVAADTVVRVLLPELARLDAVVLGGDRVGLDATLDDPRLVPLRRLVTGRILPVVDPRQRVLLATPVQFRAVMMTLTDP